MKNPIKLFFFKATFFQPTQEYYNYRVFHQFRQAKFDKGGSILSSSQFLAVSKNEAHFKSGQNKQKITISSLTRI
jgi:hypothetical protein